MRLLGSENCGPLVGDARGCSMDNALAVRAVRDRAEVLNSWKEIAVYMGRGVRTVQRYERRFGLPVRRLVGKDRGAVVAFSSDLDDWLRNTSKRHGRVEKSLIIAAIKSVRCAILDGARLRQQCSELQSAHREALQKLTNRINELMQFRSRQPIEPSSASQLPI